MPSGLITEEDIEAYLEKVKESINSNRFCISNRPENEEFFNTYCCTEADAIAICRGLTCRDFSKRELSRNQHKSGHILYFFGKKVPLIKKFDDGTDEVEVELYIKFDLGQNGFTVCVSFHKAAHQIRYYFNSHTD